MSLRSTSTAATNEVRDVSELHSELPFGFIITGEKKAHVCAADF